MKNITDYLQHHRDEIFADIRRLVSAESPSGDKAAVDRCGQVLQEIFQQRLGLSAVVDPQPVQGDHLKFTLGNSGPQITLLGHFDTVWDHGDLVMREEDGKLYGPGVLDMKAGLVQAIWAVRALQQLQLLGDNRIVFLCNSDEEIGSPSSHQWISRQAEGSEYVLVVEPAEVGSGNLKVARKGSGQYQLAIVGLAAHAGNNPEEGISAVQEMAHQVLFLHGLNDPARGTTVNVGIANGGSRTNVVADRAELGIDTRTTSAAEAQRLHEIITAIQPVMPGISLTLSGGQTRPPMEQTAASRLLLERAQQVANTLGFNIEGKSVGGGSDGNFTAALGIATLDGLGASGVGIHARNEHIYLDDVVPRAALLAGIILGESGEDMCQQ